MENWRCHSYSWCARVWLCLETQRVKLGWQTALRVESGEYCYFKISFYCKSFSSQDIQECFLCICHWSHGEQACSHLGTYPGPRMVEGRLQQGKVEKWLPRSWGRSSKRYFCLIVGYTGERVPATQLRQAYESTTWHKEVNVRQSLGVQSQPKIVLVSPSTYHPHEDYKNDCPAGKAD